MSLLNSEFRTILSDTSKQIDGDIDWQEDEDHSPALEFKTDVRSDAGWPLFVRGSFNALAGTLTFSLILKTDGRMYGLDMGKNHHNPTCQMVGDIHKHRWSEIHRDKIAYRPDDITRPVSDPVGVWQQFCNEANIIHNGAMKQPAPGKGGGLYDAV